MNGFKAEYVICKGCPQLVGLAVDAVRTVAGKVARQGGALLVIDSKGVTHTVYTWQLAKRKA